jgi:predicted CoA-binding protein
MSEKPIAKKLLIRENYRVLLINEPNGYRAILGELPANVGVFRELAGPVDLIQVFVTSMEEARERLPKLKSLLKPKGSCGSPTRKGLPCSGRM